MHRARALRLAVAGVDRVLVLAAAPVFAAMALLAASDARDVLGSLCSSAGGSHLAGMPAMYGAMCVFHLGPWLRLLPRRPPPDGEVVAGQR